MRARKAITCMVQGLRLEGIEWPAEGPTPTRRILALHGWLDNAESFSPLAQTLPDCTIVAMDLPGHGLSAHRSADASYHFIDWVATVLGILDALAWPKAVLMGHSMGAGAATLTAATRPERALAIVLLDALAPYTALPEAMPDRLISHLNEVQRRGGRLAMRPYPSLEHAVQSLRRVVPNLSQNNAALLVGRNTRPVPGGWVWRGDPRLRGTSVMTLTQAQLHAFLKRVACPALFVRAPDGLEWDEGELVQQAELMATLETLSIAGGHHLHMEQAQQVGRAVALWLNRHLWATPALL